MTHPTLHVTVFACTAQRRPSSWSREPATAPHCWPSPRARAGSYVEAVIEEQGELASWQILQRQPAQQTRAVEDQLHRFFGTRSGRKEAYARLLVEALDLERVPAPLEAVLRRV
jgi:hypothetical protein